MRNIYRIIFIVGIIFIAIGGYGLLTQSTWSNAVNSLFTIFGVTMSFAQLFVSFPLLNSTAASNVGGTRSTSFGATTLSATQGTKETHFVSAGALLLACIGWAIEGFLALINFNQGLENNTLFLITNILLLCALPGLHLKQAKAAGGFGSIAALIVTSAIIINIIMSIIYIINFNPGQPIPSSIFTLQHVNNYFLIAGNISWGISFVYARIYPPWAGIALMLTGCAGILLLLNPPVNIYDVIAGLWDITLAILYVPCAFILFP